MGTNYTITDAGINATLLSTNRTLALTYPTINSLNKTTTVEYNDMSVRTLTLSGNDTFIVTYAFVHSGVKLIVNGSTEVRNNFEFTVNSSGSQHENSFRSGNIVFDWSDVVALGLLTSWSNETNTLSVGVGSAFVIDALIYTDGFESGDINAGGWGWYGYEPSIVSAPNETVWKGNYSCLIDNHGDSGMGLIKYIQGNDPATLNLRAYFYISTLPSINQSACISWITGTYNLENGSSINYGVAAMLAYSDDNHAVIGVSQPWNDSESPSFSATPTLISANSWYCVEIGINSTGGYLWINGALEAINLAYASQGQLNEGSVFVGNAYRTGGYLPNSLYIDEVAYSDPYIGLSPAEFPNLGDLLYDFDDQASSLSVAGTVNLYSLPNYGGYQISFTNTIVDLTDYPIWWILSWNDYVSSLEVQGTVTLFQDVDCQGKTITLTNKAIPYDNLGNEWNNNSNLVKSQGAWDCRSHNWLSNGLTECFNDPPTSSYMMNWASDGLASGYSSDNIGDFWWHTVDLAQGFDVSTQGVKDLEPYTRNDLYSWSICICSLKVAGSVTIFDSPNYKGQNPLLILVTSIIT